MEIEKMKVNTLNAKRKMMEVIRWDKKRESKELMNRARKKENQITSR